MSKEWQERVTFVVPDSVMRVRVDKVIANHFDGLSRTHLEKAFHNGQVWVDGKLVPKRYCVDTGQRIELILPKPEVATIRPVAIPIAVLYEDKAIIAVNKAAGIVVHPGSGTGDDTLTHALLHHTQGQLSRLAGQLRPGVVHRLDKETSGVIVYAKTDEAYLQLIRMFAHRQVDKQYLALVDGQPRLLSGVIKKPIGRHKTIRTKMSVDPAGKSADTAWALAQKVGDNYALLRCWPHTGRTHQIRVHLQYMGHPILGDVVYGYRPRAGAPVVKRVLLHAAELVLAHPITKKPLHLRAPLPEDFLAYQKLLGAQACSS